MTGCNGAELTGPDFKRLELSEFWQKGSAISDYSLEQNVINQSIEMNSS